MATLLPSAYVVDRKGDVFSRACLSLILSVHIKGEYSHVTYHMETPAPAQTPLQLQHGNPSTPSLFKLFSTSRIFKLVHFWTLPSSPFQTCLLFTSTDMASCFSFLSLHFQVMVQPHNRHMSMSLYIAALAISDTFSLLVGKMYGLHTAGRAHTSDLLAISSCNGCLWEYTFLNSDRIFCPTPT